MIAPSAATRYSQRQTGPPPPPVDDGRRRDGKQSSADHRGALGQARHADARDVGRQQRAHRRADRDADAADDLGDEEQAQGPALDGGGIPWNEQ